MQTVQTDGLEWDLICSDEIKKSRAEWRCRSDLLAKCHWISLDPTPLTLKALHSMRWSTERWSAGRLVMSSAHFMIDTALYVPAEWAQFSSLWQKLFGLLASEWIFHFVSIQTAAWLTLNLFFCLLASHSPLCPLIFYLNLNSQSATKEGHLYSPDHHFGLPSCSNVWIFSGMKNLLERPTVIYLALLTRPLN